MLLKNAMTSEIHTASTGMTVEEAGQLMEIFRVSFLPVVAHGKAVGVVSSGDIVRKVVAHGRDPKVVRMMEIMSDQPICVDEDMDVAEAAVEMRKHQTGRLLVTRADGTLAGVFTLTDLAMQWGVEEAGEVLRRIAEPRATFAFAS